MKKFLLIFLGSSLLFPTFSQFKSLWDQVPEAHHLSQLLFFQTLLSFEKVININHFISHMWIFLCLLSNGEQKQILFID